MGEYLIIDAHSHLWLKQDTMVGGQRVRTIDSRSEFLGEIRQMLPPFMIDGKNTAEVFLSNMNYAQVGGAVVVQEFIDGNQNEYLSEVVKKYPDRFRVFGMTDYLSDSFAGEAEKILAGPFVGMAIPGHRLHRSDGSRVSLNGDEMMKMMKSLEASGKILSLSLEKGTSQIGEVEDIITECPRLKIAIAHFGMVTCDGWKEQIRLARHENVMIESGGITWLFNSEFYPFRGAVKAIREAIDMVGGGKLMWGSDYPRTITAITYRMSYDFITKSDMLSEEEKRLFLGENAGRFYGFGELPTLPYIKNMSE